MAEITEAGYQTVRDFINSDTATPNTWDYIALYDDSQNEVLRRSISGDSRCRWFSDDGDAFLKAEIVIEGSDGDVPVPTTFEYSAVFDDTAANSGSRLTPLEQHPTANVSDSSDRVVVVHTVEIPDQP